VAAEVVVPAEDSERVLADETITDIDGLGEKYDFTDNNNSYFL